jgi:5-methylcytosine-specific restriction endonuclease McrA
MARRDPVGHRTPAQTRSHIRKQQEPKEVGKRVKRNAARRKMVKAGAVRKGDGKEVGHIKPLRRGGSNVRSNLRVESPKKNRAHGSPAGGRAARKR